MSTNSPPYLSDLLTVYTAARQLRPCSDNSVLRRPSVRTVSYGQRSFAYSAPSAWNALPQQVRSSDSVSTFKSRTKTHLFRLAYQLLEFIHCYLCSSVLYQRWCWMSGSFCNVMSMICRGLQQCVATMLFVTMFLYIICNHACNRLCAPCLLQK